MRKPVHLVALALWVFAAVFFVSDIVLGFIHTRNGSLEGVSEPLARWMLIWGLVRFTMIPAAGLLGLGMLVELVDQIRWNSLAPENREASATPGDLIRRARGGRY